MLSFEQFLKQESTRQPRVSPRLMEALAIARLLPPDADPNKAPNPGDMAVRLLDQVLEGHRLMIADPTGGCRPADKRLSYMLLNLGFLLALGLVGADYQPTGVTE